MENKKSGYIRKKLNINQSGYSIVMALVAAMVIALACTSILLAISANLKNAAKEYDRQQARTLAQTLSYNVIRAQLDAIMPNEIDERGTNELPYLVQEDTFAGYIYKNISWRSDDTTPKTWKCYDDDKLFYTKENSIRTFDLTNDEMAAKGISAGMSIYWQSTVEDEQAGDFSGRKLIIEVSVSYKGKGGVESASVTTTYISYTTDRSDSRCYYWKSEV